MNTKSKIAIVIISIITAFIMITGMYFAGIYGYKYARDILQQTTTASLNDLQIETTKSSTTPALTYLAFTSSASSSGCKRFSVLLGCIKRLKCLKNHFLLF